MHNDLFEPNLHEPISRIIIGHRISLASEKSRILLNGSVIISGQSTEDMIPNMKSETVPSLTIRVYQNLLKRRQLQSRKKKRALTSNTNERKWRQPRLQLHLVTKTHGRQELGLPTSSAHLGKMMLRMMFQSIQTLYEWHIYWTFPLFRAWREFCFTIFICSLYRLWAPSISLYALIQSKVRIFHISDAKYVMFRVGWRKSLKQWKAAQPLLT